MIQILIFILAGVVTWVAGVALTKTTDSLDCRYKIGDAFGGLILLGVAGSLPEVAIALSAAFYGHLSVIVGNLIGGVAIQTLIIVIFDFVIKGKRPLSYLAGSVALSFEAIFAIILTAISLLAMYIPSNNSVFNMNPVSLVLPIAWIIGLYLINKSRKVKRFNQVEDDSHPGKMHDERRLSEKSPFFVGRSNVYVIFVFLIASVSILIAGFLLEEYGTALAYSFGLDSGLFAATAIAFVTSLPELSTGIEAVLIGDNHLAISDIWGGNAFMLVPFFVADLIAGKPILSGAVVEDKIFALLGIIMMGVYATTFVLKLKRRYFRLGLDSILEIILYGGGIFALFYFGLI